MNDKNITLVFSKIKDLDLAFQPIVKVNELGHTIQAYEFLLRYGEGDFFPFGLFEELIATESYCDILNEWYSQKIKHYLDTYPDTRFSLNIDFQQMVYPSTWEMLKEISQYKDRLLIEITEFYHATNKEYESIFPKAMTYIRNLGMKIAFDDVGNGLHSLGYVTSNIAYVDSIKLSLLHFRNLDKETLSSYIDIWVKVAKEFNVVFVVEGVEEELFAKMLYEKGVTHQQGYYWSVPSRTIESTEYVNKS